MEFRRLPGLSRAVSRVGLGAGVYESREHAYEMLDRWRAQGGNLVDTGHVYQDGESERRLGDWMEARGCRQDVVVVTKGCHPDMRDWHPRVTPAVLRGDLTESLRRLKTSYVDIYLLHRDDPSVPVGPLLEALNEHKAEGRVLAFGASNWTTRRLDEAAEYAASRGLEAFCVSSPHLSLVRQNEPPWPGCVSAWDRASLNWYLRRRMPLLAWSSQAGGFFGAAEHDRSLGIYANRDNEKRLRRVKQLAREKGCEPIQIALAWVLNQPFPVYALIGPRNISELDSSLGALRIQLSQEEMAWLYAAIPSAAATAHS